MITLAKLKEDLEITQDLGEIVGAFKTVALIQFRLTQSKRKLNYAFIKEVEDALNLFAERKASSPYFSESGGGSSACLAITSDEGFLGELNALVINAALDQCAAPGDQLIVLGERGARNLEGRTKKFTYFPGLSENILYEEAKRLSRYILKSYGRHFKKIEVIYPEFVSLTLQRVRTVTLLPYRFSEDGRRKDRYGEMLIEPGLKRVLEELVAFSSSFKLFEIFWSAKLSEYAARIMHLEGSTQELNQVTDDINLAYFKQLHALSDKTIREISASKILLKKRR